MGYRRKSLGHEAEMRTIDRRSGGNRLKLTSSTLIFRCVASTFGATALELKPI